MKLLSSLALSIVIGMSGASIAFAQEDKEQNDSAEKYELSNKEEDIVDTSIKSFKVNELKDLYSETAKRRAINFDRKYVKEADYSFRSTVDFNHPSLNMLVTEITETD